jgi:Ni/Co efflux regulator RcnB
VKPFILLTLSVVFAAPDIAISQPAPVQPSPVQRPQTRPAGPQMQPGRPGFGGPQIQPPRPGRPGNGGPQIQPPRPGNGGPQIQPPRPGRPDVRPPRPPHHRPPHHRPPFHYPHGYHYRRWHAGLILPSLFLAAHYSFHDYAAYGLPYPPHGFHWVRYGPDLVLVNSRNGHIRDVRYGVFR